MRNAAAWPSGSAPFPCPAQLADFELLVQESAAQHPQRRSGRGGGAEPKPGGSAGRRGAEKGGAIPFAEMARALRRRKMVDDVLQGGEARRAIIRMADELDASDAQCGQSVASSLQMDAAQLRALMDAPRAGAPLRAGGGVTHAGDRGGW